MRYATIKIALIIGLPVTFCIYYYNKLTIYYPEVSALRTKMDYIDTCVNRSDVVFLGSSRTLRHINPRIIDSIDGVNSYNLGSEGEKMAEIRMMLGMMLERGWMPRLLVINVDYYSMEVSKPVFSFVELLTYAERDPVVYKSMAEVQDVYACRWKYPFYRLQRLTNINDGFKVLGLFYSRDALKRKMGERETKGPGLPAYKGFEPVSEPYAETYMNPFKEVLEQKGLDLLQDVIDTCKERGIKIVLVTAPMYKDYKQVFLNCHEILARVGQLAARDHVPYYNMLDDSLSQHKEYFFNFVHLNERGADLYSIKLANLLQETDTVVQSARHI